MSIGLVKTGEALSRSILELSSLSLSPKSKVFFIGSNKNLISQAKDQMAYKSNLLILPRTPNKAQIQKLFNTETKAVIIEDLTPSNDSIYIDILKLIPQMLEAGINVLTTAYIGDFAIAEKKMNNQLRIAPNKYKIPDTFLHYISRVIVVNNLKPDLTAELTNSQEQKDISQVAFVIATHINHIHRKYILNTQNNKVFHLQEKEKVEKKRFQCLQKPRECLIQIKRYIYVNQLTIMPTLTAIVMAFLTSEIIGFIYPKTAHLVSIVLLASTAIVNFAIYPFIPSLMAFLLGILLHLLGMLFPQIIPLAILSLIMVITIFYLATQNKKLVEKEFQEINDKTRRWDTLNAYAETLLMASTIKEIFTLSSDYFRKTLGLDIVLALEPSKSENTCQVLTTHEDIVLSNTSMTKTREECQNKYSQHTFLPLLYQDEESLGYVGIKHITARSAETIKKDETLLNSALLQLAIAIQQRRLTKSYNNAVLTSEKEQLRSIILSSISHDLKTPLTTIIGSCTALQELDNLPERSKAMLVHTIHEASNQLNQFISNILESSRLATESILQQGSVIYLDDVVNVALQRCKQNIKLFDVSVNISNSEKSAIHGDFTLIQQVLFNVIENATKYSPIGSKISISITNVIDNVLIKVSDEGPGIQPDKRNKIFDKFYRFNHADSTKAGTGLGLAICKQIIDAYHGNIWVSDRDDGKHGAQFNIELTAAFSEKAILRESGKINNVS